MTSTTRQYSTEVSEARSAMQKLADFWTQGAQTLSDQTHSLPGLPKVDLIPAVERYFEFLQRTVDMNRDFTIKWVKAASMMSGVLREQTESVGDLVREQADTVGDIVREQADATEQAAREQAERAEQAEQELAVQARKAERSQAKEAHEKARQRYEGLTKGELSDLLAKRELTKSGNIDELIERLVESDGK